MQIWYEWDEDLQCNVFTSSVTLDPEYTQMYSEFGSKAKYQSYWSIASDFPLDHFVFYLEEDEKNFVKAYEQYFVFDVSRAWQRPANPEGFSWCDRCKVFHEKRDPNLPPIEEEIASLLAAEIQREIDNEIINEIRKANP